MVGMWVSVSVRVYLCVCVGGGGCRWECGVYLCVCGGCEGAKLTSFGESLSSLYSVLYILFTSDTHREVLFFSFFSSSSAFSCLGTLKRGGGLFNSLHINCCGLNEGRSHRHTHTHTRS